MTAPEHNLQNILEHKWKSNELGHFYIFSNNSKTGSTKELTDWTKSLIEKFVYNDKPNLSVEFKENFWELGHPDMLWIESSEKAYSHLDETFIEFFQACEFKPLELRRKIVVIEQCSKLSQTLANKMLKTLEDSNEHMLFIFLNPGDKALLPTIKSRSINLSIVTKKETRQNQENKNFATWLESIEAQSNDEEHNTLFESTKSILSALSTNSMPLSKALDAFKGNKAMETIAFNILSSWMSVKAKNYHEASQSLEVINWWQEQRTFNNASASRLSNIIQSSFK